MGSIVRIFKIIFTFLPVIPPVVRDWENDRTTPHIARRFRIKLQKLGPAFIKFGQMLSLRYDYFPQGYCEELQNLLDKGEVIPFKKYIKLLEDGLNIGLGERFRNIDMDPVGCASLAQVHSGYLSDGTKVAVKVLRPNVKKIVKRDIRLLKLLAKVLSLNTYFAKFGIEMFVREFERWTLKELDLKVEGQNCDTFRENFKEDKEVKIPQVFWEATSKSVLTTEFIDGIFIKELIKVFSHSKQDMVRVRGVKVSRQRISELFNRALFTQVLEHGFFHGDPHPANMIITPDGKFAFLDFGIVGTITDAQLRIFTEFLLAIAERDVQKGIKYMIAFDQIEGVENIVEFKKNVEKTFSKMQKMRIGQFSITQAFLELIREGAKAGIDWPVEMFLLGKMIVTLDGVGRKLYPNYKMIEEIRPFVERSKKKNIFKDISAERYIAKIEDILKIIAKVPESASEVLDKLKKGELQVLSKQDPKSLELKSRSLKVWALLVINICWFAGNLYLISTGADYEIFKGINMVTVLTFLNLIAFLAVILELFKD